MTRLNIDYPSFADYMNRALNSATRTEAAQEIPGRGQAPPIEMSVVADVAPIIDDVYPLYLQVYERSKLHFEKLTREYLLRPRPADAGDRALLRLAAGGDGSSPSACA